jgi:HEAT repeat protein
MARLRQHPRLLRGKPQKGVGRYTEVAAKSLKALDIIQLLETPSQTFPQLMLRKRASIKELCRALESCSKSHTRQILCDVLGFRHAKSAVSPLLLCLDDAEASVRSSAADALGKIGDPRAGAALMKRFEQENVIAVRRTLAVALGAVGCKLAVPLLINCLTEDDLSLRGCAAWSLGMLRAIEALPLLHTVLQHETEAYPKTRIQVAIQQINSDPTPGHNLQK